MVRGQGLSGKKLIQMSSEARINCLNERLGITGDELKRIWGLGNEEERLKAGANLLYEKCGARFGSRAPTLQLWPNSSGGG